MSRPGTQPNPIGLVASTSDEITAIAARLVAGGHRVIWLTPAGRAANTHAHGIEYVATAADVGGECGTVLTLIDDTDDLRRILFGTPDHAGLGVEMKAGSVLVDLGVRPPRETQSFLGMLGMRGVAVVDGAILGSPQTITDGGAVVLAGGFAETLDSIEPLLRILGRIERTGPLGSAHTAAALMGYVEAAHAAAREEALAVGRAFGVAPGALDRVVDGRFDAGPTNVLHLRHRAELAKRLAADQGYTADIISFPDSKRAQKADEGG